MIKVWTQFRQWFNVKDPKKIEWWKTLSRRHPAIKIKELE